ASVLVETVQYTGILGIIPCSYRLADVDDLLTNTLGGVLGALVAPWVLRWMPRARALAQERGRPRPVTVWRRWLGMLVDVVALGRSEEHTSELQSRENLVCRLLLEKKKDGRCTRQ